MRSLTVAALLGATCITAALAVETNVRTGKDAFGSWKDDSPGIARRITAKDMPPAAPEQDEANAAQPVPRPDGAKPNLPPGYAAELLVKDIENPRTLRIAPNGDLFVADSKANQIRVFRLSKDGKAIETSGIFAKDLHEPYGIAFYPPTGKATHVYIANSNSVVRFPYNDGDIEASGESEVIVDYIPAAHHWTRDLQFSPDGKRFFLSVGSGSNVALDMSPQPFEEGGIAGWEKKTGLGATWDTEADRAQVLSYDPEGNDKKTFATGLRNCAGLAISPDTGAPWCVVNERDGLGPDTPFEYATEVKQGAFYGWPWYYIGGNADDRTSSKRPDLKEKVTLPDVLFQAHSAPLGIAFYTGENFPEEVRGDAFVTMHGSWNRGSRTGYKVVRLPFESGKPTGEYVDFMTGFVLGDDQVWGRPVGVTVAKDGALLVSEDGNGTIWRVTYSKP